METLAKINQFMTRLPYRIDASASLSEVLSTMKQENIRHLPVFERGRLIGVITQHQVDLVQSFEGADRMTARDIMSRNPFTVGVDASLRRVCLEMATHFYDYAFIKQGDQVVGIFTSHDAIRILGEMAKEQQRTQAAA